MFYLALVFSLLFCFRPMSTREASQARRAVIHALCSVPICGGGRKTATPVVRLLQSAKALVPFALPSPLCPYSNALSLPIASRHPLWIDRLVRFSVPASLVVVSALQYATGKPMPSTFFPHFLCRLFIGRGYVTYNRRDAMPFSCRNSR